jgi:hypothetical protein
MSSRAKNIVVGTVIVVFTLLWLVAPTWCVFPWACR